MPAAFSPTNPPPSPEVKPAADKSKAAAKVVTDGGGLHNFFETEAYAQTAAKAANADAEALGIKTRYLVETL